MTLGRVVAIVLVVLAASILCGLFVVQNLAREVQLSLDLGFRAWQLERPVSVPVLIAICIGTGMVLAGVPLGLRTLRLQSRLRKMGHLSPVD
jgi:uncharacterized integral membrane protein